MGLNPRPGAADPLNTGTTLTTRGPPHIAALRHRYIEAHQDRQRDLLDELLAQPLETVRAYTLSQQFDNFYEFDDPDMAEEYLRRWITEARGSRLEPLAKFCDISQGSREHRVLFDTGISPCCRRVKNDPPSPVESDPSWGGWRRRPGVNRAWLGQSRSGQEGRGLVSVEQWAWLRREHFVGGVSIKRLARQTGLSRNTIRKALRSPAPPAYSRPARGSMLGAV